MKRRLTAAEIATVEAASWVTSHLRRRLDALDTTKVRWSRERAWEWSERTPWLVGANFVSSTAGNQLEMFQAATFDPVTIDRELGWAADLGMNSMRIFLHDLLWETEGSGFLDRVDEVLSIAASHGIGVMPVLFDGIWDPRPQAGPQGDPKPGVHNSMWLQSPGASVISDRRQWARLRGYVEAVMGRFATDDRVQVWDLFNEPDSPNPAYAFHEARNKQRLVAELLEQIWDWADGVDPDQPVTAGLFMHTLRAVEARPVSKVMLERSDVISFHSYQPRHQLVEIIDRLEGFGRPLLCTEWMGRPTLPVSLLEVFEQRRVGCWTWGLVDGRTQTNYPWTSWFTRYDPEVDGWFHDLLRPDGTPYDTDEAALFRRVTAAYR